MADPVNSNDMKIATVAAALADACKAGGLSLAYFRGARGTLGEIDDELTALRARVAELEEQVKEAVVRLARVPDMLDRERREGAEAMRERAAAHAERYVRRWSARYLPESIRALPLDDDAGEESDR